MSPKEWPPEALEASRELAVELGQIPPLAETVTEGRPLPVTVAREPEVAEEGTKAMHEVRIFTENQNGIPMHWHIQGETVEELLTEIDQLGAHLTEHGYKAHSGFSGNGRPAAQKPVEAAEKADAPAAKPDADDMASRPAPRCAYCQGEVWDNRPGKKSGQYKQNIPDFKCRDKDGCGGAAWIQKKTGDLRWAQ